MKKAIITGTTGQDGAYLAELLLAKGYEVHGIKRRASFINTARVDHLYQEPHMGARRFIQHYGDVTDATNLTRVIQAVQPDEIYNLAAQSHVAVSIETLEQAADSVALGMSLDWHGQGLEEQALDLESGEVVVAVDPRYFRPTEVDSLLGNPAKAREKLGWVPATGFAELAGEMAAANLEVARREVHGLCANATVD